VHGRATVGEIERAKEPEPISLVQGNVHRIARLEVGPGSPRVKAAQVVGQQPQAVAVAAMRRIGREQARGIPLPARKSRTRFCRNFIGINPEIDATSVIWIRRISG